MARYLLRSDTSVTEKKQTKQPPEPPRTFLKGPLGGARKSQASERVTAARGPAQHTLPWDRPGRWEAGLALTPPSSCLG